MIAWGRGVKKGKVQGGEDWEMATNGNGVSFLDDENVLELIVVVVSQLSE